MQKVKYFEIFGELISRKTRRKHNMKTFKCPVCNTEFSEQERAAYKKKLPLSKKAISAGRYSGIVFCPNCSATLSKKKSIFFILLLILVGILISLAITLHWLFSIPAVALLLLEMVFYDRAPLVPHQNAWGENIEEDEE